MLDKEHVDELRAFIAIAAACWREREPSYSWHVLDWRSHRMRQRYPIMIRRPGCWGIVTTAQIT